MAALSVLFFFTIEHSVLMVLVFYYKGLLEKVSMQRTQQFADFSLYNFNNLVNCSANIVSPKIAIEYGIGYTPFDHNLLHTPSQF